MEEATKKEWTENERWRQLNKGTDAKRCLTWIISKRVRKKTNVLIVNTAKWDAKDKQSSLWVDQQITSKNLWCGWTRVDNCSRCFCYCWCSIHRKCFEARKAKLLKVFHCYKHLSLRFFSLTLLHLDLHLFCLSSNWQNIKHTVILGAILRSSSPLLQLVVHITKQFKKERKLMWLKLNLIRFHARWRCLFYLYRLEFTCWSKVTWTVHSFWYFGDKTTYPWTVGMEEWTSKLIKHSSLKKDLFSAKRC